MTPGADIATLHNSVRETIEAFSFDDPQQHLMLECDFKELFDLIKLFLISERDSYYGYFLMAMKLELDFESNAVAGIKLNEYPPVFLANPLILGAFSLKEMLYIVCHEIDHVVFNHPAEMVRLNPEGDPVKYELFNLAADASVNDRLNDESYGIQSFMEMPQGAITSDSLKQRFGLKGILPLQSYRYYYDLLLNSLNDAELADLAAVHAQRGSVSPLVEASAPFSANKGKASGELPDGGYVENANSENDDDAASSKGSAAADHAWGNEDDDYEAVMAETRELLNAVDGLMDEETRGNMPGCFIEQVDMLNAPPAVPWQVVLKRYVGTVESGYRKTRSRLNRRQPKRFDLSGALRARELNIVVVVDVSGSVTGDELAGFFNEVFSILARSSNPVTIIECDTAVQRVYKANRVEDVRLDVRGRGGTAFSPAVEYINAHREFRDALVVFFTDGFGEEAIPKPRTYRNLWVVLDDANNLSVENPYGSVVVMGE